MVAIYKNDERRFRKTTRDGSTSGGGTIVEKCGINGHMLGG